MKLFAIIVLVACGGNKPSPTPQTHEMKPDEHAEHHDMGEMHMSPEMTAFHDVLAPRWHAAKGEQRMKDTCGAIADFKAKAGPIGKPELVDAVSALEASCQSNDATAFEASFAKVHETFHAAMESSEHK